MTRGDGSQWLGTFLSLSERLRSHIVALVPACVRSLGDDLTEDGITRNLVSKLMASSNVRSFVRFEYHFEPFWPDEKGNSISTGQIDFVAYQVGAPEDRERYLAYECKCVNKLRGGRTRSGAREYVCEGILRFVEERYAANVPMGCMLGYVINGDLVGAESKIHSAVRLRSSKIALIDGPTSRESDRSFTQFDTIHSRLESKSEFKIRHLLVSCIEN